VSEPPASAIPIHATFAEGIELLAISPPRSHSGLGPKVRLIDLYWRLSGRPSQYLTIDVELHPPVGAIAGGSHELVSSWANLRGAPIGPVIRDVVPLEIDGGVATGSLRVTVKTRGGRWLTLLGPGRARGADDELRVDLPAPDPTAAAPVAAP